MKNLIKDAVAEKLTATLEGVGGAAALYGDPVALDGRELIPVARIRIELATHAEGEGGGKAGLASALRNSADGKGEGNASAGVTIHIEPVGVILNGEHGPELRKLDV